MTYQVIASAQAGIHNDKRESYGDTLIIDPWGTIVGRLPGKNFRFPTFIKLIYWNKYSIYITHIWI
jgi:predicted amidohydrolase